MQQKSLQTVSVAQEDGVKITTELTRQVSEWLDDMRRVSGVSKQKLVAMLLCDYHDIAEGKTVRLMHVGHGQKSETETQVSVFEVKPVPAAAPAATQKVNTDEDF